MAAPSVQTRGTPAGAKLRRGFRSKFTFGGALTLPLWEFEVTGFSIDGGDKISNSTFFNTLFHTFSPQALLEIGAFKVKGLYDPDIFKETNGYKQIMNVEQACTMLYPNLGTVSVFGYGRRLTQTTMKVNDTEAPALELDVEVTCWDYINHVEAGFAYADGYTGTSDS